MQQIKLIVAVVLVFTMASSFLLGIVHAADGSEILPAVVNQVDAHAIQNRVEQAPLLSSFSYRNIITGFLKQYLRDLILRFVTMKLASMARTDFNRAAKVAFFMGSTFISSLVDYITKTTLEHLAHRING